MKASKHMPPRASDSPTYSAASPRSLNPCALVGKPCVHCAGAPGRRAWRACWQALRRAGGPGRVPSGFPCSRLFPCGAPGEPGAIKAQHQQGRAAARFKLAHLQRGVVAVMSWAILLKPSKNSGCHSRSVARTQCVRQGGAPGEPGAVKAQHQQARAAARFKLADLQRSVVAAAHLMQHRLQHAPARRSQRLLIRRRKLRPRKLCSSRPSGL